jgi:hypothetical protein
VWCGDFSLFRTSADLLMFVNDLVAALHAHPSNSQLAVASFSVVRWSCCAGAFLRMVPNPVLIFVLFRRR